MPNTVSIKLAACANLKRARSLATDFWGRVARVRWTKKQQQINKLGGQTKHGKNDPQRTPLIGGKD